MTESNMATDENFVKTLMCFSYACSANSEVTDRLKYSNKICLPESILFEKKEKENVTFPLFFKIKNPITKYGTVCGVEEFTAPPGVCHLPYQIMSDISVEQGSNIELHMINPPNGDFVKLRFHTSKFSELSDPKQIMEEIMSRDYPVLSQGQTIILNNMKNNKQYYVDIVETRPTEIIQIINTNLNVDFAQSLDTNFTDISQNTIVSPQAITTNIIQPPYNGPIINSREELLKKYRPWTNGFIPFSGRGYRLGSK